MNVVVFGLVGSTDTKILRELSEKAGAVCSTAHYLMMLR